MQLPERDGDSPPPIFEAARAPIPPVVPEAPPLPSVEEPPAPPAPIARWRWAMSLLLVGFYPAVFGGSGRSFDRNTAARAARPLPSSARGLVFYSGLELGIFGIFWLLGWAFSRATKDQLLLRWRGGFKPVLQGFGYALALRLGLVVVIIVLATLILAATGIDPKQFAQFMKDIQPNTDALFPKGALSNPIYLILMMSLLSFVVAGVREELWRTACLASLRHLLPAQWSERARWIGAIVVSSVVFGFGHLYQGGLGVVFTAILGRGPRRRDVAPSFDLAVGVRARLSLTRLPFWRQRQSPATKIRFRRFGFETRKGPSYLLAENCLRANTRFAPTFGLPRINTNFPIA